MSKAKFQSARELIEEKRYAEARAILQTIDHPKAQEWLTRLDALEASKSKPAKKQRTAFQWLKLVILIISASGLLLFLAQFAISESNRAIQAQISIDCRRKALEAELELIDLGVKDEVVRQQAGDEAYARCMEGH